MAGICGVIFKKDNTSGDSLSQGVLQSMLLRLGSKNRGEENCKSFWECYFGTLAPISDQPSQSFVFSKELDIYCVVDGLIYIDISQKHILSQTYNLSTGLSDIDYLPYLYLYYKTDYVKHIDGWFNIFLFDRKKNIKILSNDRIGLLPLFYYETDTLFIFASKIESILASGLTHKIEFDTVTLTEYLLFNYPVSSNTLIKEIATLPAAVNYTFSESIVKSVYWNPGELISSSPLSKEKSIDLIDEALRQAINKPLTKSERQIGVTLTGGWDGRLILAYILKEYREKICVFSFGSESSPDIKIPVKIAAEEGFAYKPFILDQEYINTSFLDSACKTILYSNGIRSYRRAHYLFVAQQLAGESGLIVSGNFGDEIMKFAQVLPSEVITEDLISIVASGFKSRPQLNHKGNFDIHNYSDYSRIIEELTSRLGQLEVEVSGYTTISEKYHHLKLTRLATKYFGAELNSYNDFIRNFSPFLDFGFISAFSKTSFSGIYYPFNTNKLKYKEKSSLLYAELIRRNHRNLLHFRTDRGYSMADLSNPVGKLSVLYNKVVHKSHQGQDPYFLKQADGLFKSYLENPENKTGHKNFDYQSFLSQEFYPEKMKDKLLSLSYWMRYITKEYSL